MLDQARRYDIFMARPAAEIDPDSPTSSRKRILPGPIALRSDRSIRMVSFATGGSISSPARRAAGRLGPWRGLSPRSPEEAQLGLIVDIEQSPDRERAQQEDDDH